MIETALIEHGREKFVGATIMPVELSLERAKIGEPALPVRFQWAGKTWQIAQVIEQWKELGRCDRGSDERYLRKHWFQVRLVSGEEVKIYFLRQPGRSQKARTDRWRLYSIVRPTAANGTGGSGVITNV